MITFACERFADIYTELADLIVRNYNESRFFEDIRLNPDVGAYLKFEAGGNLLLVTARADKKLVGYASYFILQNPHYRVLQMYGDLYYVHPDYRTGTGLKMLKFAEEEGKKRGVVIASNSTKTDPKRDNSAIFKRLGYDASETVFVKRLDHA